MLVTAWPGPLAAIVVVPYLAVVWPFRSVTDERGRGHEGLASVPAGEPARRVPRDPLATGTRSSPRCRTGARCYGCSPSAMSLSTAAVSRSSASAKAVRSPARSAASRSSIACCAPCSARRYSSVGSVGLDRRVRVRWRRGRVGVGVAPGLARRRCHRPWRRSRRRRARRAPRRASARTRRCRRTPPAPSGARSCVPLDACTKTGCTYSRLAADGKRQEVAVEHLGLPLFQDVDLCGDHRIRVEGVLHLAVGPTPCVSDEISSIRSLP